jgi:hypothetical protein
MFKESPWSVCGVPGRLGRSDQFAQPLLVVRFDVNKLHAKVLAVRPTDQGASHMEGSRISGHINEHPITLTLDERDGTVGPAASLGQVQNDTRRSDSIS